MAVKLNARKEKAVLEYLTNGFDKMKALAAGNYKVTEMNASKFFSRPDVVQFIDEWKHQNRVKYNLDEDWVIQRLMNLADTDIGMIISKLQKNGWDLSQLDLNERYAITEFSEDYYVEGRGDDALTVKKAKVKGPDKLGALTALCRKLGLFNDKLKVEGEIDIVQALAAARENFKKEGGGNGGQSA